jgi:hypothetical protein
MACFHPISAWQRVDGAVVFVERGNLTRSFFLPCGRCQGCRLERSRQWAVRCMHEASMHEFNCFITLTYDDVHCPVDSSLDYRVFQLFMKRLRKRFSGVRVRFFMAGEYGEQFSRPHFHACIFGLDFLDKVYFMKSPSGEKLFRSSVLEELWPMGFSSVGAVTFQSAGYVARYVMKKVTGSLAASHYEWTDSDGVIHARTPEFAHMSLKPGIGFSWLCSFLNDVDKDGKVVVNGVKARAPRYYDKVFDVLDPQRAEDVCIAREVAGKPFARENWDDRLLVREEVFASRISSLKRTI